MKVFFVVAVGCAVYFAQYNETVRGMLIVSIPGIVLCSLALLEEVVKDKG
jgi:hypothetical protein